MGRPEAILPLPKSTHPRGLPKVPTGIVGLDELTRGGSPRGRATLISRDGVLLTPTLVRGAPAPVLHLIGDLRDPEAVRRTLGLGPG